MGSATNPIPFGRVKSMAVDGFHRGAIRGPGCRFMDPRLPSDITFDWPAGGVANYVRMMARRHP